MLVTTLRVLKLVLSFYMKSLHNSARGERAAGGGGGLGGGVKNADPVCRNYQRNIMFDSIFSVNTTQLK